MQQNIYVCTFANINLLPSSLRFLSQATNMGIFTDILLYNEYNLDLRFKQRLGDKFYQQNDGGGGVKPTRGFGYWCWKPQVILQSLEQMNDNDWLIYADSGCEFIHNQGKNLLEKLQILKNHDIVGFRLGGLLEKQWTKGDIFAHFGVLDNPKFIESPQIKATAIFMKKSPFTLQLINEWLEIIYNHFYLVDDSPSITPNYPEFRENRHDQSIFSMLMKKYDCFTYKDYKPAEYGLSDSRKKQAISDFISRKDMQASVTVSKVLGKIYPSKQKRRDFRSFHDNVIHLQNLFR